MRVMTGDPATHSEKRSSEVAGLVEALVALEELSRARALLDAEWEAAAGARTVAEARLWHVRGLLLDGEDDIDGALAGFHHALDLYDGIAASPVHAGRVLLSLGAALRRRRQKQSAREPLDAALRKFEAAGATIWAQRARTELALIGGRRSSRGALTTSERRIADLVARGRSNHEVARELQLSPKTVEWNLTKIYRKLNVASRTELAAKLAQRRQVHP
jgi:DNA-binding CsgD family transcriptional regulator